MKIICPDCGFSREMPAERLPKRTVIANCPHCGCRFRFSPEHGVLGRLEARIPEDDAKPAKVPDSTPETDDEDDPLPPGAIVPNVSPAVPKTPASRPEESEESPGNPNRTEAQGNVEQNTSRRYIPTDDENIRIIAPPQQQETLTSPATEQDRDDSPERDVPYENPWLAAPYPAGWLSAFYQTLLRIMLSSTRFFASLKPEVRQNRALLFYLIVCVVETCMDRLWGGVLRSVLEPGIANDPQLSALLDALTPDANPVLSALKNTALLMLQAYFFSGLMYLMYRLVIGNRADFSIIFQVVTYSVAPHILSVVPVLGILVGTLWGMGCLLVGMRVAMKMNWAQTIAGLLPVLILFLFTMQQIMQLAQ